MKYLQTPPKIDTQILMVENFISIDFMFKAELPPKACHCWTDAI